jgi:transcriptional regulator with XRE-family HTH domain
MVNAIQPKSLFGQRLREARLRAGIPQDKLGVMIGIDEGSSSARISRYENGIHSPPFELVEQIAKVLKVPAAYFYCRDDKLAEILLIYGSVSNSKRTELLVYASTL